MTPSALQHFFLWSVLILIGVFLSESCSYVHVALDFITRLPTVSPILLLEAQEQTREIFGSETEHLLWSQAKQGSTGLKVTEHLAGSESE